MTALPATTARPRPGPGYPEGGPLIDRMPPHDLSAEAGVIGSIIIDPPCFDIVRMMLPTAEVFFKEENATIYRVLLEMLDRNLGIDAMILHSTLRTKNLLDQVGGIEYIKELANAVPTSFHASYYAAIVKDKWTMRGVITACSKSLRMAYEHDRADETVAFMQQAAALVAEVGAVHVGHTADELLDAVIERLHSPQSQADDPPLPTGFIEIDNALGGGLRKKWVVALGGHSKHGKSALAVNIAANLSVGQKIPGAVITWEMTKEELEERLICSAAGSSLDAIKAGLQSQAMAAYQHAVGAICSGGKLVLDDTCDRTLNAVRGRLLLYKRLYKIRYGVLDYFQLMESSERVRYEQLVAISRGIKKLACELDMPLIVAAQFNADAMRDDRLPTINDYEGCKQIGKDANVNLLLDREWKRKETKSDWLYENPEKEHQATLGVSGRSVRDGVSLMLRFEGYCTRFSTWNL